MAYQGRILARSPYYITASGTAIDQAELFVYIWSGAAASKPVQETYRIKKTPVVAGDNEIQFEISELVRDFFVHNRDAYDDTLTDFADALWVETSLNVVDSGGIQAPVNDSYIAVDGYGYFSDGVNALPNEDDKTLIVLDAADIEIPIQVGADGADSVEFYLDSVLKNTQAVTETTNSQSKLEYVTQTQAVFYVDEIRVLDGVTLLYTITVINQEACEHTAKELKYYDRDGGLAVTYMFAKDVTSLQTSRDTYQKDIGSIKLSVFTYDQEQHQKSTLNVTANESIIVNSGFVPESQNEVYKQILLSKLVWLDDKPVHITSNNLEYKTVKNDSLINYTLTFDYAYNEINNIY